MPSSVLDEDREQRGVEDQEDRHRAADAEHEDRERNPRDRADRAQELGERDRSRGAAIWSCRRRERAAVQLQHPGP
jgi:hypothetical protein